MTVCSQTFLCHMTSTSLCLGLVSLDELAKQSDFLTVCCALTPETKEICNKDLFSKMKNTSIFINTSRYILSQDKLLTMNENSLRTVIISVSLLCQRWGSEPGRPV